MIVERSTDFDAWDNWFVAYTRGRDQQSAMTRLHGLGFPVFMPTLETKIRKARKLVPVSRPLFPRYLFLSIERGRTPGYREAYETLGVITILTNRCGNPAPVDRDLLVDIHESSVAGMFDRVKTRCSLSKGQHVRILQGPLSRHLGKIRSIDHESDALEVLYSMLGQEHVLHTSVDNVESA